MAAIFNVTFPAPWPAAPDSTVIHGDSLFTVHLHFADAVIISVSVVAVAAESKMLFGFTSNPQICFVLFVCNQYAVAVGCEGPTLDKPSPKSVG